MGIYLAPSILSANFWELGKQVEEALLGGADLLHLDVMDGKFVPNISVGFPVLESLRDNVDVPIDAHLMIEEVERYAVEFVKRGASWVSFHVENTYHIHRVIEKVKREGARAGVALNPATPLIFLEEALNFVDFVLIMSVNPGFGGQKFIRETLKKIKRLKEIREERGLNFLIEVDGGIKEENLLEVLEAGAEVVVVGSGIFRSKNIRETTKRYKKIIESFQGGRKF